MTKIFVDKNKGDKKSVLDLGVIGVNHQKNRLMLSN
jgi:hypothetical protein